MRRERKDLWDMPLGLVALMTLSLLLWDSPKVCLRRDHRNATGVYADICLLTRNLHVAIAQDYGPFVDPQVRVPFS